MYQEFPSATDKTDVQALHARMLAHDVPGFVVRASGASLAGSLAGNGIDTLFSAQDFTSGEENASFYHTHALPQTLNGDAPSLDYLEWEGMGITYLHSDTKPSNPGKLYAANFTRAGVGELRAHQGAPGHPWDDRVRNLALEARTGDLWWRNEVDPQLMAPKGYRTLLRMGDLAVFDGSLIHTMGTREAPREANVCTFVRREIAIDW